MMSKILRIGLTTIGIGMLSSVFILLYGFLSAGLHALGVPEIYAMMFAGSVMCILSIAIYNRIPKKKVRHSRITGRMFGIILILTLIFTYCSLTFSVWLSTHLSDTGMSARSDTISNAMDETGVLAYVFYSIIAAPIMEEIIYRLCIYNFSKHSLPVSISVILTGAVFGLSHMTAAHSIIGTLFGIFLVLVYEFTGGRLSMCIFCHMYYNFVSVFSPSSLYFYHDDAISTLCLITVVAVVLILYKLTFVNNQNVLLNTKNPL